MAVLSVLTVLALLAASYAVLIQLDMANANAQMDTQRLNMLLRSGLHHAVAALDAGYTPDALQPGMRPVFGSLTATNHIWITVCNSHGRIEGRYRVTIEDEAAKANLNTAFLMGPSRAMGWDTGEVDLPHALGLSPAYAARLVDFRYGPNKVPGARGDDDRNNVLLMSDGIDNNANGVIDEDDEGVDDPGEYSPYYPVGDDRRFTSIAEALSVLLNSVERIPLGVRRALQQELPRRATLHALDMPGSATLPRHEPADLNVVNVRQARRVIGNAQTQRAFGGTQRDLNQLAVNIVDYRDQNHVLSTFGSLYGVEAVNFNELLANDGTEGRYTCSSLNCWYVRSEYNTADLRSDNPEFTVGSASLFYEFQFPPMPAEWRTHKINDSFYRNLYYRCSSDNANFPLEGGWDVEVLGPNRIKLLGPSKTFDSSGNEIGSMWSTARLQRYAYYRQVRAKIGTMQPITHAGNPGTGRTYSYESFRWPADLLKNCYVSVANTGWNINWHYYTNPRGMIVNYVPFSVKITSSSQDGVLTLDRSISAAMPPGPQTNATRCVIWGWKCDTRSSAWMPAMTQILTVQALQPGKYYLPYATGWQDSSVSKVNLGFAEYPAVWDDDRPYPGATKRWPYGGDDDRATPVRATPGGYLDLGFRSGSNMREVTRDNITSGGNAINGVTLVRPEVLELINVSARPLSLRGWTLTFNTGSIVNDIGTIDHSIGYSAGGRTRLSNPIIGANGYFYLVNNEQLFNADFGTGRPGQWGVNASQRIPIWQIPSDVWGVQYRIKNVTFPDLNHCRITVPNENFRPNQFRGEIIELQDNGRTADRKNSAHGSRFAIQKSGRDWFEFFFDRVQYESWRFNPSQPAYIDTVMLLGMPAKGGVVSMTLKNEYKQITARTVTYAYRDQEPLEWYGQSVEKTDPTHYNWVVRQTPTIGGTPDLAHSHAMRGRGRTTTHIKNGPYVSVGELQRVRIGRDFENIGAGRGGGVRQQDAVGALASAFSTSALRLEAADERAERTGWQSSVYAVTAGSPGALAAGGAAWEVDQWKGHTVRFLTGRLRGEMFPVFGNTRSSLRVSAAQGGTAARSTPGGKIFTPAVGDMIAVGPGYATGLCYARRPEERGEWTWRRRVAIPGTYHMYVFGLSDSISTTEFLEENDNAALDVEVWNYQTQAYDMLCRNQRYGKDDGLYAGQIMPAHTSADGDIKLRLTPRGVGARGLGRDDEQAVQAQQRRQSGYAWFNYAMITPVPVPGRVNINTAGERLLGSLPGITPEVARAIARGTDTGGRAVLKPYAAVGDLINVRGMTPEIFERSANLFCLDSGAYTVEVQAQTVKDINADDVFDDKKEPVQGERRARLVVRTGMGPLAARMVNVLEQYTP